MYRASTPIFYFRLKLSEDEVDKLKLTYSQYGAIVLEKEKSDLTETDGIWRVQLTQEESNLFKTGYAKLRVRVKRSDGAVLPTRVYTFGVRDVENDEVI